MSSKNKSYLWPGIVFTCLGVALFSLVFFLDFKQAGQKQVFDTCLGFIFLYLGIKRIIKSRQPDDFQEKLFDAEKLKTNQVSSFEFAEKKKEIPEKSSTPKFIKYVALFPLLPLSLMILAELGCRLLGFRDSTCIGIQNSEALAYWGALGWLLSLLLAGLLKLIYSSSKL
ncbi:MAG: hypothetical protein K2Q33_04350 [Gammaproteobacteria bacterium]|nr:hypothetical protein [Gammaproteobacteria bacterium]